MLGSFDCILLGSSEGFHQGGLLGWSCTRLLQGRVPLGGSLMWSFTVVLRGDPIVGSLAGFKISSWDPLIAVRIKPL